MRTWAAPDPETVKPFPEEPESRAENPPDLLASLHNAYETKDAQSSRYTLGCIQFRGGTGVMAATDGYQMLLQRSFQFSFPDDILARPTSVFGSSQLPSDAPVLIGQSAHEIFISEAFPARFPRIFGDLGEFACNPRDHWYSQTRGVRVRPWRTFLDRLPEIKIPNSFPDSLTVPIS